MNKDDEILNMGELFLHRGPTDIILLLLAHEDRKAKSFASNIAKGVDVTYSHTVKILDYFKTKNLVSFEKSGRIKYVKLTDSGRNVAKALTIVKAALKKV